MINQCIKFDRQIKKLCRNGFYDFQTTEEEKFFRDLEVNEKNIRIGDFCFLFEYYEFNLNTKEKIQGIKLVLNGYESINPITYLLDE